MSQAAGERPKAENLHWKIKNKKIKKVAETEHKNLYFNTSCILQSFSGIQLPATVEML